MGNKKSLRSFWIKATFLLSGLLCYYLGDSAIYLWGIVMFIAILNTTKFSQINLILLACLLIYFLIKFSIQDNATEYLFKDIRFFWGFLPFYLFFSSEWLKNKMHYQEYERLFHSFFLIAVALLLIEFITSNLLGTIWPNRFHNFELERFGGFARSYGFGANATVTTVSLVALSTILYRGIIRDIPILVIATSATAALVVLIKSASTQGIRKLIIYAIILLPLFYLSIQFLSKTVGLSSASKLSTDYFLYIVDFKLSQIEMTLPNLQNTQDWLLGIDIATVRTGDFQGLDWFMNNGILGMLLFSLFILVNMRKDNFIPIIFMIIGTLHYQVIFSMPGAIIFAWLLNYRKAEFTNTNTLVFIDKPSSSITSKA